MPSQLPFDPKKLKRELRPFYIGPNDQEIDSMLGTLDLKKLDDLFAHIPENIRFKNDFKITTPLSYSELQNHVEELAGKNPQRVSFIGDGLKHYQIPNIINDICQIRGLTTAYTPYQPERSQGTLITLWLYASTISKITGMEAINASLYDRSTCLYEALLCATRLHKDKNTVIVYDSIYPGDKEVLETQACETTLNILYAPIDSSTGKINQDQLAKMIETYKDSLAGVAFPQTNSLGILEDVHWITTYAKEHNLSTIAIIDPMLLFKGGLVSPAEFGENKEGVDMIVGDGQHLCLAPNYGGPGLGLFGIRYNENNKNDIRSTAGRFVGSAKDQDGKNCFAMVLSTREQHIRREKATSNICSNQSFVATIAGAAILARGEQGHEQAIKTARANALQFVKALGQIQAVELAFPDSPFFNEVTLKVKHNPKELIQKARQFNFHLGVDVTDRVNGPNQLLQISFFDTQTSKDIENLIQFFIREFGTKPQTEVQTKIPANLIRTNTVGIPFYSPEQVLNYYKKLGNLNASPDDNIYPLGSCTMKYNPYINDYAASLPGFTNVHPQAPIEDAQGCLEILYQTQEWFKKITGLAAVTTQPVAGAQGELVGIKMFQAYHRSKNEKRDIVLIPKSAHGTNPATATMAGYETGVVNGEKIGIILIDATPEGLMDFEQVKKYVTQYGKRIAGVMVTNPNTSGVFERQFKEMADLIHSIDGLVYMDGANMNAISGIVNLGKMGVDAVHNNLHKTWTIPHGGGGPGDGIVAVSAKLVDYLPGHQVVREGALLKLQKAKKSIGSFHRHFGNFAHKVRCYTYLRALGDVGIVKMSSVAVLSARYLYHHLKKVYPTLPAASSTDPIMHEFILTLTPESFKHIEARGVPKAQVISKIGKLFLDFGIHAPTVSFPEQFGLMIEPTESFDKSELDRFIDVVKSIHSLIHDSPEILKTAPHFTPVAKVDEVTANKDLCFVDPQVKLPEIHMNKREMNDLDKMKVEDICKLILLEHKKRSGT